MMKKFKAGRLLFMKIILISAALFIVQIVQQYRSSQITKPEDRREVESKSLPVCTARHRIAFLKVHKAGSSTVANILQRFALENELNVLLPYKKHKVSHYNYFDGKNGTLARDTIIPIPSDQSYDMIYNHVKYNGTLFRAFLPSDTFYLAIVREPVERFMSAARYYGLQKRLEKMGLAKIESKRYPFSKFLSDNGEKYRNRNMSYFDNSMAGDFGVPLSELNNVTFIKEYVKQLDKEFHFVMLMEYFDESLILLKRYLCFDLMTILYITHNSYHGRKDTRHDLSPLDLRNLMKWQQADFIIYNHFAKKFSQIVQSAGTDFLQEVRNFKDILRLLEKFCYSQSDKILTVEESPWNKKFQVTKENCNLIKQPELKLHDILVTKALERVNLPPL